MSDLVVNYHFLKTDRDFAYHDQHRSEFQTIYADYLCAEPGVGGRVLDIGCGHGVNPTLQRLLPFLGHLDGVDPFPVVEPPSHLENRWTCALEEIPVPSSTYDMAYSYNVVEHVADVRSFLSKAIDIIKPGGVYWSLSPNSHHPFTMITRIVQGIGLKGVYAKYVDKTSNHYMAYYRLSNDSKIVRIVEETPLPVSQIDFYYAPNVQWDKYFPAFLRFVPHFLDSKILLRRPRASFIFMFRIRKSSNDDGTARAIG